MKGETYVLEGKINRHGFFFEPEDWSELLMELYVPDVGERPIRVTVTEILEGEGE